MNEIDQLRKLAAAADRAPVVKVDVAAGVIAAIAARRDRPLGMLVGLAAAAAIAALLTAAVAWQDWSSCTDPLHGLFGTFAMVTQ